jgi:iron(III) transport system permease protein
VAQGVVLGLAVALLLACVAYPMLWLFLAALGIPGSPTLEHLARVATRAQNFDSLANTLQLAFGTGLLSIALGVPLAWATARSDMPLRRSVHALVALSYITPPYLTALACWGPTPGISTVYCAGCWAWGLHLSTFSAWAA